MYSFSVISKHPEFKDKALVPYLIDKEFFIGAFGNEPYAIVLANGSHKRIEVRISIDGTDVLTGEPATTETAGRRWVVEPRGKLLLETWPETERGGARFLFADDVSKSVAVNTHGVMRDIGVIAAAIFTEDPTREQYTGGSGVLRGGGPYRREIGGTPRGSSVHTQSLCMDDTKSYNASLNGTSLESSDSRSIASTGAGEYAEQRITQVAGLQSPVLAEVLQLRYLWWDALVAKLKTKGISPSAMSGFPGFPGNAPFKGVDLKSTPRTTPAAADAYRRISA